MSSTLMLYPSHVVFSSSHEKGVQKRSKMDKAILCHNIRFREKEVGMPFGWEPSQELNTSSINIACQRWGISVPRTLLYYVRTPKHNY